MNEFFDPLRFEQRLFPNIQEFDYSGIEGRLLSSSYVPAPGDAKYEPMLRDLRKIFNAHAVNDRAKFEYQTRVYFGRLK